MNVHIDEVLDFVACPALYKFRYIDKIDPSLTEIRKRPNKHSIVEAYDKALHQTIFAIFHSAQDGLYLGLNNLSKKWGTIWVKPRSLQEDVRFKQTSWRDTHEIKRVQGWTKLKDVWEYYKSPDYTPIMVDYRYRLALGTHILEGNIDLVRVIKNHLGREEIEMVEFVTDETNAPFLHVRRDWRVTAASLAFRETMNVKEEKIVYHGIISGKITETKRDETDYTQLKKLLDNIEKCIDADIFYPVFNKRCMTCPYEKHCEKG